MLKNLFVLIITSFEILLGTIDIDVPTNAVSIAYFFIEIIYKLHLVLCNRKQKKILKNE